MLARARVVERDAVGAGVRVVGTCADITAQKHAQEALRELGSAQGAIPGGALARTAQPARRGAQRPVRHRPGAPRERPGLLCPSHRQSPGARPIPREDLHASRITRGKIRLQKARLDLVDLARRSAEENRFAFAAKGIDLRVDIPPTPLWIDCDATRIVQVLGNLLQNAAKFTRRGHALLAVGVDATGREARIRVRDTGVGITPELQARLFRPFEQGDGTLDRSGGGLGLGLALVKGLVELHGGTVEAHKRTCDELVLLRIEARNTGPSAPAPI